MPNCGSNILSVVRPSQQAGSCATTSSTVAGCSNTVGPADCLNSSKLTPRRNRGAVIDQIKDYVLLMLGAPVVSIEMDDQALDMSVKQTLKIMEYYAPREYFTYYSFITSPGKSVYKMPPDVGYVRHVAYRETGSDFAFQSTDLQGAIPIEYFYPGGAYASIQGGLIDPIQPVWGRMGEWVLYKGYERMYSRVSSALGGWEWVGGYGNIKLYPIPQKAYHVLVHYMQKCYDWEETTLAMQEGALAHAMIILGNIRKKYASPPGPGGGIVLDGAELHQEGKEMYDKWKEDLVYRYGDLLPITLG
jgi:hypothetical protein